jgi:hypothetical protein
VKLNPVSYKCPTNGCEVREIKLRSKLFPPKPMFPRESSSKIEILVSPEFDPRNIGYRLA